MKWRKFKGVSSAADGKQNWHSQQSSTRWSWRRKEVVGARSYINYGVWRRNFLCQNLTTCGFQLWVNRRHDFASFVSVWNRLLKICEYHLRSNGQPGIDIVGRGTGQYRIRLRRSHEPVLQSNRGSACVFLPLTTLILLHAFEMKDCHGSIPRKKSIREQDIVFSESFH